MSDLVSTNLSFFWDTWKSVRRNWQRAAWQHIQPDYSQELHNFMRRRLERWQVGLFPRTRAERAVHALAAIRALVPPRVLAAGIRTMWNGWVAARRVQRSVPHRQLCCCFGCAHCAHVARFARSHLRLVRHQEPPNRLADFLLLAHPVNATDPGTLARQALRTAAVYRAHNTWRHRPEVAPHTVRESLPQHLKEMIRGHAAATRLVAGLFAAGGP